MQDCDVAVIGYGPTGMGLAALLGQAGHRVVVLERYAGLYNLPRAACFDDEIMRTFQKLGIEQQILPGVNVQPGYQWVNAAGEILVEFEYDNPAPGGWAAQYMMYQPHVEDVLDRLNKSLPSVEVRQGTAVTDLEEDETGVTLSALAAGGPPVRIRARYVVGADGGNGFTRRKLGVDLDDYGFQENWLVCDFEMLRTVETVPTFRQICDPAQPISIVNIGPRHHRFSFMLNPGETTEQATAPDRVWARVARFLGRDDARLVRVANYTFRSRIVDRWRHGRVFLAGDAAHEMPPFLAQGMCSGLRDAHNLAWKFDLVLRGKAGDALLDTYQGEREPQVRFITEKAIALGRVQTTRDPDKARERDERMMAERRANQKPGKLRYPGVTAGLVEGSGEFVPQGRVSRDEHAALLDSMVGSGWTLLARDQATLAELSDDDLAFWRGIGGRIAIVTAARADRPPEAFVDLDGVYGRWFDAGGAAAALVRPDWYLYGAAPDASGLAALVGRLAAAMPAPLPDIGPT